MSHHEDDVHACLLVGAIKTHLIAAGAAPAVYLVPSTRAVISRIGEIVGEYPEMPVVAPQVAGSMPPVELLKSLRESPRRYPVVIIFSDQLLGPDIATISAPSDGGEEFFSGLEPVLFSKYGYVLKTIEDEAIVSASPPGTIEVAVSFLKRYFCQASKLGDAWLASARQSERTLSGRVHEARLRAKYFQSSIYHVYGDRPLDEAGRSVLARVSDVTHRLTEASR